VLKRTLFALAVPVAFGVAPGVAGAATIAAGPSGIVYSGGDDINRVHVQPSEQGDLLFEERNEAVAITNLVASCAVDSGVRKHRVRCEAPGPVFEVDAGGRGDAVLTAGSRRSCGPIGFDFQVEGGGGADAITAANDAQSVLEGGPSRDYVLGCGRRDEIRGGPGGDRLDGFTGPDRIMGGGGGDRIEGGDGGDELIGGLGSDRLGGDGGSDVLRGGDGSDRLAGRFGSDVLSGGPGADRGLGGGSFDDVSLGAGDDQGFVDTGTYTDTSGRSESLDCGPGFDLFSASPDDQVFDCEDLAQP
jgi:Ca2+-binding RTX toxin-like protein